MLLGSEISSWLQSSPLDDPLNVAPVYWQHFILHLGASPSTVDLYTQAHALIQSGL